MFGTATVDHVNCRALYCKPLNYDLFSGFACVCMTQLYCVCTYALFFSQVASRWLHSALIYALGSANTYLGSSHMSLLSSSELPKGDIYKIGLPSCPLPLSLLPLLPTLLTPHLSFLPLLLGFQQGGWLKEFRKICSLTNEICCNMSPDRVIYWIKHKGTKCSSAIIGLSIISLMIPQCIFIQEIAVWRDVTHLHSNK